MSRPPHGPRPRRDPARLRPGPARRRRAGHPGPRPGLPGRGRAGRARRRARDVRRRAGPRCAPRPTTWPATTRCTRPTSTPATGCPRPGRPRRACRRSPGCRWPRATAPADGQTDDAGACGPWPATPRCCGTATSPRCRPPRRHRLAAMFATLRPRPPRRRTSRHQRWHRGTVDASRTLRASLRRMGEPAEIAWRRRGNKPRRVVLLVDVSGSMSGYADALLRLAHRLTHGGGRRRDVHASAPGSPTSPARCAAGTPSGRWSRPARPSRTGPAAPGWARRCEIFLDRWGQRGLARGAVVVVFSDGWERGDPSLLAEQMARLQPGRAPGGLGQPAPRQARLRAGPAGRGGGAALRRRLRGRPLAGDVRRARGGGRPCVTCCPS